MSGKMLIVDYGMGNLNSVKRKLNRLKIEARITSDIKEILSADKLILPGVGHFSKAMENLQKLNLIETLHEVVLVKQKPILGICLGMQLMAKRSEEGNTAGLGWFNADVVRFKVQNTLKFKVPHTGWNQIVTSKKSMLMQGIPNFSEFYFVHSYHFIANDTMDILNETIYDYRFTSGVEKNNIFGVQYHPEKSHDVGEQLLSNFIEL
ncbi:MAG: imidazole glycerol phosphate synthase subunit HisH [Bacteroidota bacterium]